MIVNRRIRKRIIALEVDEARPHYFIPAFLNETKKPAAIRQDRARRRPLSISRLTYADLMENVKERCGMPGMPAASSLPNMNSALNAFLEERCIAVSEPIGATLRVGYYRALRSHLTQLRADHRDDRYIANRKSAILGWRRALSLLDRDEAIQASCMAPFTAAINTILPPKVNLKKVALKIGMPVKTLVGWRRGNEPRASAEPYLAALERLFGCPDGYLRDLVPSIGRKRKAAMPVATIAYRERQKVNRELEYALKPTAEPGSPVAVEASYKNEWLDLVKFKVEPFSAEQSSSSEDSDDDDIDEDDLDTDSDDGEEDNDRQPNKPKRKRALVPWRVLPMEPGEVPEGHWQGIIGGGRCHTAEMRFEMAAAFTGWLQLDPVLGGLGYTPQKAQTLAHFANWKLQKKYLKWRVEKSGGITSGAVQQVILFFATLQHPEHGFLVHRPDLGAKLGFSEPHKWKQICEKAYQKSRDRRLDTEGRMKPSRDSFEPIESILELDCPMDAVADAALRLDEARPFGGSPIREAWWGRKRLLLSLLSSNPLRARNMRELTWRADNTGELRKDEHGRWEIFIRGDRLKNANGAARHEDYRAPVQDHVVRHLERYLREYRPMLAAKGNDHLFVTSKKSMGSWKGMQKTFRDLTRQFFVGTPGFGMHAMRHIVATTIIKDTGSFELAAKALHDQVATVKQHYARFKGRDGANALAKAAERAFKRM